MNWEAAGAIGEIVGAVAVVLSLIYLTGQIRMSNRLAKAEAYRAPNSDLNSVNSAFGVDPAFRVAMRKVFLGATRQQLPEDERTLIDYYMVSVTNTFEQLAREVEAGILDDSSLDFGGQGIFQLPYFKTSWPLYRSFLASEFVEEFERKSGLDPTINAEW